MEWARQLPDVLDVVDEDTYQTNNESHTMKATRCTKINEYPSYPYTSGRMGATANDCTHMHR